MSLKDGGRVRYPALAQLSGHWLGKNKAANTLYHLTTNATKRTNVSNVHLLLDFKERQIQSHGTSNSNYLTQLAKVENQCKEIFKQCSQVLATVDKVETNSKDLNLQEPLYF